MSDDKTKLTKQSGGELLETQVIPTDEEETEAFAKAIMQRAAALKVVKIQRDTFLRTEIRKRFPGIDAELAIETTPAEAGIAPEALDQMAIDAIEFETAKCAGLSFLSGIPGGLAMIGTVPADLAQYFAHIMRIEQKLAYIYGWQSFLNENDEVDDETVMKLVVLMGIMMQVGGVANAVTNFASNAARKGVEQAIQKQALTKTIWYNPMKKVLRYLGVNLTKQTFAKTASKVVPVIGGAISGGMTCAAYKPGAERLRRYLRSLPTSGIDEALHPDITAIEADRVAANREKALTGAKTATLNAMHAVGALAVDTAESAGAAVGEGLQLTGNSVREALEAAGGALESFRSKAKTGPKSPATIKSAAETFEANVEQVKRLKELLDCGILSQKEFEAKKKELLGL